MARYQKPPDPRQSDNELNSPRPRRQRDGSREPIPWLWLGLGVVVTIIAIFAAVSLANAFLDREPLVTSLPTPTILRLTAPASAVPSPTSPQPSPTAIPTFTPRPTPDVSVAPEELTVGYYAEVANTDGIGVSMRGGASTDSSRLLTVPEGTSLLIIDGPRESNGFFWWQVRLDDGTEGWVAGDFIIPAAAPPVGGTVEEAPTEEPAPPEETPTGETTG
jgi:hypothetical protein